MTKSKPRQRHPSTRTLTLRVALPAMLVLAFVNPLYSQSDSLPNVLLIVSDDQRPDTISALGNNIIETPNLDRLVKRGTVFVSATCANPICTPSRAELLTGCSGLRNGVFDFGRTIDPGIPTLPEPFNRAGYATWYCGKWHNDGRPSKHGYAGTHRLYTGGGGKWWKPQVDYRGHEVTGYKGWIFRDASDVPLPELGVGLTPEISQLIADGAIDLIRKAEGPFLIHINFTAPHDPLLVPAGYEDRYKPEDIPVPRNFLPDHPFDHGNKGGRDEVLLPIPRTRQLVQADLAAYYAVITHMDAQVGRMLDALEEKQISDNTIVVFCSDHGLGMGSHGLRGKQNMYEHTIRVPMIFAGPGIPKGKRLDGHAYLRDIFPTLCDLARLDAPTVDGKSQLPVLQGRQDSAHEFTVGYFRDSQRMIRTDRWKLIDYPLVKKRQLFDLKSDPFELTNLVKNPDHKEVVDDLAERLADWMRQHSK